MIDVNPVEPEVVEVMERYGWLKVNPIKPTWRQGKAYCGKCGKRLITHRGSNYCDMCGVPIEWSESKHVRQE